MRTYRSLFGMASVALALGVASEVAAQDRFAPRFRLDTYTTEEGLPGQAVTRLTQTEDGYLWMIVSSRVVRFDGVRFDVLQVGAAAGLPEGRPMSFTAAGGDTLWVTVVQGGRAFDTHVIRYTRGRVDSLYTVEGRWPAIVRDGAGDLWLGRDYTLARIQDGILRDTVVVAEQWPGQELGFLQGPDAWLDRFGDVWIRNAATDSLGHVGLDGFEAAAWSGAPVLVTRPSTGDILFPDRDGDRAVVRDREGSILAVYPASESTVPRLVDREGRLWVTDEQGLSAYRGPGSRPLTRVSLPGTTVVTDLMEDREGNIWGRTETDGLLRIQELPTHVLGTEDGIRVRQVVSVVQGQDGSMLSVDRAGYVYRIREGRVSLVYGPGAEPGSSAVRPGALGVGEDRTGRLWVTIPGSGETEPYALLGLRSGEPDLRVPTREAARVIEDDPRGDGTIWFGGRDLYRGRSTGSSLVLTDTIEIETEDLRSLAFDSTGVLWAPVDHELLRVTEDSVTSIRSPDYPDRIVRAALADGDGTVWLGTYGGGLIRYRDGVFRRVTREDGLAEDVTSTLLLDPAGNLWMGGNLSVHRVSLEEVNRFLAGEVDGVHGVSYGREAGIRIPETSGWQAARDSEGRLWFPTFDGIVVVDPDRALALEATPPLAHIEGLQVGDDDRYPSAGAPGEGEVLSAVLAPEERRFEVGFTAISFRNPEAVRFRYRLEGFDEGWSDAEGNRRATYTNVGSGSYTFRVQAVSGGGVVGEEATLRIVVEPYLHETRLFWLGMIGAVLLVAVLVVRYRERRILEREARLNELVEERTRALSEERERAEAALETVAAQADRLRSLDEARSRFFANVSHEFRTPLTLMVGPLKDLREGRLGSLPAAAQEELEVVLESGERLTDLVEQLLDIARLEAGELRLKPRRGDLTPLLKRVARTFHALAPTRGIDFRVEMVPGALPLIFDEDRMEKVLNNLLANAFKFTDSGGTVTLRARRDDTPVQNRLAGVLLEVEDDGIGIPEEALERVFDRFYQVDDSPARRHPGAGVGLALAREFVGLHGGTISVESQVGSGTRFRIRLPSPEASPLTPVELPAASEPPEEEASDGAVEPGDEASVPSVAGEDVPTVLLVEDEPRLRTFLRRHLEDRYRVVEAEDGETALALAREVVPDLILSDVMMPRMDGEALVQALRSDPEMDFIPVILLTARASHESVLSGLRGGADDYVTKPFDVEEVLLRVRNVIESRHRLRARFREEEGELPVLSPPGSDDDGGEEFARRIHEVLSEGALDEDFGVEALAGALFMSRSSLYRRTEEELGRSPMDVIWEFRLDQAAQWLRETDARVNEIAYGVGFKSVPHFSRKFRERFGRTPTEHREG